MTEAEYHLTEVKEPYNRTQKKITRVRQYIHHGKIN